MPTVSLNYILPTLWGLPKKPGDKDTTPFPWNSPVWTSRAIVSSLFPDNRDALGVIRRTLNIDSAEHDGIRDLFSACVNKRGELALAPYSSGI